MPHEIRTSFSVRSPINDYVVAARLEGQTDDDWYALEIAMVDDTGDLGAWRPLLAGHMPRNVSEIVFSQDAQVLAALAFHGRITVWRRSPNGRFDQVGTDVEVGVPIYDLQLAPSGDSLSVRTHLGQLKEWRIESSAGDHVKISAAIDN